jgi:serine phosphatase RsbU (regulator of sigma subunit)
LGLRAILRTPIGAGQPADLMLVLGWRDDRDPPDDRALALIERFGYQVDVALTQARRREMQTETERLHQRFERSLLPKLPVSHPGLDIHLHYQPGERKLVLGGDFVDVVDLGKAGIALLVGDVSGHGPDAAALGATLRSAWEALVVSDDDPVRTAQALRRVTERERDSEYAFATALLAWIDPDAGEMTYLNLGHPPPYLCHGSRAEPLDDRPQPPLGATDRPFEPPRHATLPEGWSLFFYTDGLIEAPLRSGTAERFGERRLRTAVELLACGRMGEEELADMLAGMQQDAGGAFGDDVAVVVVSQSDPAAQRGDRTPPREGDATE